jgi:polar amino acid transport system substrate-binding protein
VDRRWLLTLVAVVIPPGLHPGLAGSAAAQEKPPLRWGGDKNGGAPYIFEDAAGNLTGFEVEFAEYLAAELGRKPVFVQNQWDNLPQSLLRGEHDIVLNGY